MNANDIAIYKRLTELYNSTDQNVKELPINTDTKYALFSDLHLGDGGKSDIFVHNEKTMRFALKYYKNNGYSIILLGDVEELWQFNFIEIHDKYNKSIYELLRSFKGNRVHRIFGNHDKDWKRPPTDPILFNENIQHGAPEAIKLGNDIFLVHGHQGDKTCDRKTWESRYLARKGKPLVSIGKVFGVSNRSATKSQIPGNREKLYYNWAKDNNVFLICGHTHNAIFASRLYYWYLKEQIKKKETELKKCSKDKVRIWELSKEIKKHKRDLHIEERMGRHFNRLSTTGIPLPCYFNTGCGHFNDGITNIEIEGDKIRLIKWQRNKSLPSEERRKKLWKEENLSELRKIINIKFEMKNFCRRFPGPDSYLDLNNSRVKDEKNKLISYAKREIDIFQKQSESKKQEKKVFNEISATEKEIQFSTLNAWVRIKNEFGVSKLTFGRKIYFVKDRFKRNIIFRDTLNAYMLAENGFNKSAVILAGSIVEELLHLYLEYRNIHQSKNNFNEYIKLCESKGILKKGISKLSDSVRHFRNIVHLKNEIDPKYTISKAAAKNAVSSIFIISNDFLK